MHALCDGWVLLGVTVRAPEPNEQSALHLPVVGFVSPQPCVSRVQDAANGL
jgi:hypothetical protein